MDWIEKKREKGRERERERKKIRRHECKGISNERVSVSSVVLKQKLWVSSVFVCVCVSSSLFARFLSLAYWIEVCFDEGREVCVERMNVEDEEEAAFLENELIGIVNFIIRPPRAKYTLADLGKSGFFPSEGQEMKLRFLFWFVGEEKCEQENVISSLWRTDVV